MNEPTPKKPSEEKLPTDFIAPYIENGKPKMTTWLPMQWGDMNTDQKDMANWYLKHRGSYSAQMEVGWHIIATYWIANNGITIKEADGILAYWTTYVDPCKPESIGVQIYHG